MVGPLASSPDVDGPDGGPLVLGVDDERADDVLSALSATTTRRVLAALHDDPAPPSELARRLDTSIQNVQYHLEKLVDAGLVEAAGTTYSEKGREMTVYRPADRALVFVAGADGPGEGGEGLLATLKRLLGGVGVLGLASLAVERLLGPAASRSGADDSDTGYQATDAGSGGAPAPGTDSATGPTSTPSEAAGTRTELAQTGTDVATEASSPADAGATEAARTGTEAARDTVTQTATPPPEGTPAATRMATETVATTIDGGVIDAVAASPGLLFFLGGLTALLFVLALRHLR